MQSSPRTRTTTPMRRVAAVAAVCAAAVSGCGGGDGESPSESPSASASSFTGSPDSVTVRSGKLGKILVDGKGRTLYLFKKDKGRTSECTGECAKAWPPMVVKEKPAAGSGVQSKLLETTSREGGDKQVTYDDQPLYRYANDEKPGDTNGQNLDNFGGAWHVLDASGRQITRSPEKEKPSDPGDDGGY